MWSGINNVMMAALFQELAQWNWNPGADACVADGGREDPSNFYCS